MNRRAFLQSTVYLPVHRSRYATQPAEPANANRVQFVSQNKKLTVETFFMDAGDCVSVYNDVTWQDAVTQTQLSKKSVDTYILEADSM